MRNKFAVPLIVIGVLLMLIGIGQRTVWAPPSTVTAAAPSSEQEAPLTVISADVLTQHSEGVDVTVSADGPFLMAVGRADDVDAWVGDASVLRIGADGESLTSEVTEGTATVPNPAGSDLWVSEQEIDDEVTFGWEPPAAGDWQILLATDGTAAAPSAVSVTFANDDSTPFAIPLIVVGALLAVLGLALAFVSGRGNTGRRAGGRGPTSSGPAKETKPSGAHPVTDSTTSLPAAKPVAPADAKPVGEKAAPNKTADANPLPDKTAPDKPAPDKSAPDKSAASGTGDPAVVPAKDPKSGAAGTTSAFGILPVLRRRGPAAALGTVVAAALAFGAAPAPALAVLPLTASATAEPGSEATPPVVLDSQLERILTEVSATVAEADAAKNPQLLATRAGGSAASLREANYATAAKVPETDAPEPVEAEPLMTDLIMGGTEFPRSVVAVTQGPDNEVPQALLLVQESARENYKLMSAIKMLPGTTFPKRPVNGTGVEPAPADSADGLTVAPQTAVEGLADALTNPEGANKDTFASNTFAEAVTEFQNTVLSSPDNEFADITFKHTAVPANTRALRTADGGAIVFGYMDSSYASVPREVGDSINLEGTVYQKLTGETSTEEGIDVKYGEGVMLYLPPAGSTDQIQVIGAVQELLSATLK
ncbi:hypothetical protein [Arthrobacter gengyunqii]|uniref:DUF8094 domain-containing protein n=1 Tax=Arthrobacter gengyunqii TaxID=2886940 RepID=A0ABS8GM41_9MICC|nr:hypothetical protein [Arthrobacter gengyunqii]MCC3267062.1 hypothetical protein [Arthrobacter gengyunqii]